jgi:hypothetical protein
MGSLADEARAWRNFYLTQGVYGAGDLLQDDAAQRATAGEEDETLW